MIATLLSTFFGVGYAPVAPGTVASAVALPLAWLIAWRFGSPALLTASGVAYLVGVWSTGIHAEKIGRQDPSECVIDEVAGQWLACALAPVSLIGFGIAFTIFRVLDISKLWPVSAGEKLPGGWGIMTDDLIAGAMTLVVIAVLRWQGVV
jgi:phosphatidylglycerophosphatase A